MARLIAPNSDSTVTKRHGSISPAAAISDSASTMWVCGEIGYAGITCGRQAATARATARDPSIWLSMDSLLYGLEGFPGGGDVGRGDRGREALADRLLQGRQPDPAGERGERAEQSGAGHGPADAPAGDVGR